MNIHQALPRRHDRSEYGFTPLEISASLITIAALTAIGMMIVNSGIADMNIRTTYVRLQDVIAATEDFISSAHSYSISTNDVISQNALPNSITPSSGGILIGYQRVTIVGAADHVEIRIQNLSQRACARLLTYDFGSRIISRSANQSMPLYSRTPNLQFAETSCALPRGNSISFSIK